MLSRPPVNCKVRPGLPNRVILTVLICLGVGWMKMIEPDPSGGYTKTVCRAPIKKRV